MSTPGEAFDKNTSMGLDKNTSMGRSEQQETSESLEEGNLPAADETEEVEPSES